MGSRVQRRERRNREYFGARYRTAEQRRDNGGGLPTAQQQVDALVAEVGREQADG